MTLDMSNDMYINVKEALCKIYGALEENFSYESPERPPRVFEDIFDSYLDSIGL